MDGQHSSPAPTVITLPREIDYANAGVVGQQLAGALTPGGSAVIADLTGTTFCDTAGLGALIDAQRLATRHRVPFDVVIPPALARIFALTGLHGYLAIHPTLTAALTAASASPSSTTTPPTVPGPVTLTDPPAILDPAPGMPAQGGQPAASE